MAAPFRCPDQGRAGVFPLSERIGGDLVSAVGVFNVFDCLGVYFQINDQECFCGHFQVPQAEDDGIESDVNDEPVMGDAGYLKIVRHTQDQFTAVCPPVDQTYRDTLILVSGMPTAQTYSMVDGVLLWLGLETPETIPVMRQSHVIGDSGFIVTQPGNRANEYLRITNRNRDDLIYDHEFDYGQTPDWAETAPWHPMYQDANGRSYGDNRVWMSVSPEGDR